MGGSQTNVAGMSIYDYVAEADSRVFDRRLAADVINTNLRRAPGTLMEKKNSAALSIGLFDRFVKTGTNVNVMKVCCLAFLTSASACGMVVALLVKSYGLDAFIAKYTTSQ